MSEAFDLYEFPTDHVGKKRFVHVEGHKRSVPVIYTYRGYDGRNKVHPNYGGSWEGEAVGSAMIMSDIGEYRSPLDGSMVTSRSQHRDHMRRHEVIEVGNECFNPRPRDERAALPSAGYDIQRAIHQLRSR